MPMKPSLAQRFRLLRASARIARLQDQAQDLLDEVREAEGATCGYCKSWRTWKELTDESTQTERRPLICNKCIKRREIAYQNGWHNWPNRM